MAKYGNRRLNIRCLNIDICIEPTIGNYEYVKCAQIWAEHIINNTFEKIFEQ